MGEKVLFDPLTRPYHVLRVWVNLGEIVMNEYSTFPKLQNESLTIRFFRVISTTIFGEAWSYPAAEM